jgi:hypothetical protein
MRNTYTAVRNLYKRGSELGMNAPSNGKRFGRMADAFEHHAVYWGDNRQWFIVAAQHRDSDSLDRSNFQVLAKMLGDGVQVAIERASHWAVGWVEYLIVHPCNRQALRKAIFAHSALCDYPILDESHFSDLEYNEAYAWAKQELSKFEHWERVFTEETENCGFSDDEAGAAIERSRERLEAIAAGTESLPPLPDPNQAILF